MGITTDIRALADEMSKADLGDKRRSERLGALVETFAAGPDKSIPQACGSDAKTEAAYRLLRNPAVSMDGICEAHRASTADRCAEQDEVLVAHDTTTFSFSGATERKGLGRIGTGGQGFRAHFALAISADGKRCPLGALGVSANVRTEPTIGKDKTRREQYFDDAKEFLRWGRMVEEVERRIEGRASLIHVMDREADDYALLSQLIEREQRFVIRANHNRRLIPESKDGSYPFERLRGVAFGLTAVAKRTVPLSGRKQSRSDGRKANHPPREYRMARLSFGAVEVRLKRPKGLAHLESKYIEVNVVHVWEENPPAGQPEVDWLLYTTEPINSAADILRIVDFYRARWVIEEYFKAIKTGCAFTSRQLESYHTLTNALAIYMPIAWRLLLLRTLSRDEKDLPAEAALSSTQTEVLRAFSPNQLPKKLTVRDAFLAIAALGGHLKSNGWPGWLVLGRGYEKLLTLEQGWAAARAKICDQS